jgi:hypothetical protein
MSRINYTAKDNAEGQLLANITAADLTIPMEAGDGALFPQPYTGSASSTGDSQTLNDTGDLADVDVGDFIYNVTDGSWAIVLTAGTNSVATTRLRNGSDNTWANGDTWRVKQFVITLEKRNAAGGVTNREQSLITNKTADNLTVATGGRGYNGTTAQAFEAGDYVTLQVTEVFVTGMQSVMAAIAEWADANQTLAKNLQEGAPFWLGTITGTDTLTGSATPARTAYSAGQYFAFLIANNNTGAVTININGLGAKEIFKTDGATSLEAEDLMAGSIAVVMYNGTNFSLITPPKAASGGLISVKDKTAPYSILEVDDGKVFTNKGATTGVPLTLPSAVAGLNLEFICAAAFPFLIKVPSGDTIEDAATSMSLIYASAVHSSLRLVCMDDGKWVVMSKNGTWAAYAFGGYWCGGRDGGGTAQSSIYKITFSSEALSTLGATLDTARYRASGVNGPVAGFLMGGITPTRQSVISKLAWGAETEANIAATLDVDNETGSTNGVQNTTKGYSLGGDDGSLSDDIEDLVFAAETSARIGAVLPAARQFGSAVSSALKGYFAGGASSGPTAEDDIYALTFSGETTATVGVTLAANRTNMGGGVNNSTHGYFAGGDGPVATIYKFVFSGETISTLAATLNTARLGLTGLSGASKGFWGGGSAAQTVIDDLNFSDDSSAQIAGALPAGRNNPSGLYSS